MEWNVEDLNDQEKEFIKNKIIEIVRDAYNDNFVITDVRIVGSRAWPGKWKKFIRPISDLDTVALGRFKDGTLLNVRHVGNFAFRNVKVSVSIRFEHYDYEMINNGLPWYSLFTGKYFKGNDEAIIYRIMKKQAVQDQKCSWCKKIIDNENFQVVRIFVPYKMRNINFLLCEQCFKNFMGEIEK